MKKIKLINVNLVEIKKSQIMYTFISLKQTFAILLSAEKNIPLKNTTLLTLGSDT